MQKKVRLILFGTLFGLLTLFGSLAHPVSAAVHSTALRDDAVGSLSSPELPVTLSCAVCSNPQLAVTIDTIDINGSTRLGFTFQNPNEEKAVSALITNVSLTDQDGKRYSGHGQVAWFNDIVVDAGQSLRLNSTFDVLPAPGSEYTFSLVMQMYGGDKNTYQTINLTFD